MQYWYKQTAETPLFPELEWDKPERKDQAGRLMIIGGNLHGFAAPAKAYEITMNAGIGHARILLPDALKRTLHAYWTDAVFCSSTPSGSFARDSKEIVLNNALWADAILLPGDLGRNSETAVLLDDIVTSYHSPLCVTKDALDYYIERPEVLFSRDNTYIFASFSQLQKMFTHSPSTTALTYTMQLTKLVEALHQLTKDKNLGVVTRHNGIYVVSYGGQVSTTNTNNETEFWRLATTSRSAVSLLHYPGKQFEALTNAVYSK